MAKKPKMAQKAQPDVVGRHLRRHPGPPGGRRELLAMQQDNFVQREAERRFMIDLAKTEGEILAQIGAYLATHPMTRLIAAYQSFRKIPRRST